MRVLKTASSPRRAPAGFTFVELLAAMLFMAIVIPVAVQGILIANRVGVVAQRKRTAVDLAQRVLTEAMVTEDWRNGANRGDFGDLWPDYNWELETEPWSEDTMQLVTARVYYVVQGQQFSESISTLGDETEPTTGDTVETQ